MPRSRSIRLSILAAAASLAVSAAAPPAVFAQAPLDDQPVRDVENSKFATSGIITSNAVYVRCGPGDNYYPTMKLDKGQTVRVVGAKFDWLKIVPPDGSFCYVAKLYVDRHGDGKVGRVNKDSINVRAGSSLSALKIGILCELNQGEDVEILGEEQEYFKIKPPAKAYLYVNKKFVEPDPAAKPEVQVAKAEPAQPPVAPPAAPDQTTKAEPTAQPDAPKPEAPKPETVTPPVAQNEQPKPETPQTPETRTVNPDMIKPGITGTTPNTPEVKPEAPVIPNPETAKTEPTQTPAPTDSAKGEPAAPPTDPIKPAPPAPAPAVAKAAEPKPISFPVPESQEAAEVAFDRAEQAYLANRSLPLDQQPLDTLVRQFDAVTKSPYLPESMKRLADSRLATIKARATAQGELRNLRSSQDALKQKQQALLAEQEELQRRIAENTVRVYTAVGTLQASSLQQGTGGVLYRVTDPATGRTVCYVRSGDAKTVALIGQFVGIKGPINEEARLGARVITPTEVTPCDPAKVHTAITAQIIPPSLMPKEPAQATTDGGQPQ